MTSLLIRPGKPSVEARRGVDGHPGRGAVATVFATALVAAAAATFAHVFRESLLATARLATGRQGAVAAARSAAPWAVFVVVTLGLTVAAFIGRLAVRRRGEDLGLAAVAAAARGESAGPSLPGTLLRASGTWVATASLASLGRESSIIETGAALGTVTGRLTGRNGSRLASAGISAAFAAAYHAPIAAVIYAEEHLGVRQDRRTLAHVIAGSGLGFLFAQRVLGAHAILPAGRHPFSPAVAVLALVALLPAYAASRLFVQARLRLVGAGLAVTESGMVWLRSAGLAAVVGVIVAFVPLAAGNGMEALRHSATDATVGVALALLAAKLVATAAAVGSGAPGGVVAPSLAVAAGAALLTYLALDGMGLHLGGSRWDGMLVAMAVGIAVSVRSPLVAVVMAAEMSGDLRIVPFSAVLVLAATALDQAVDARCRRAGALAVATRWRLR